MKRILCLCLCAVLLLGLCSCRKEPSEENSSFSSGYGTVSGGAGASSSGANSDLGGNTDTESGTSAGSLASSGTSGAVSGSEDSPESPVDSPESGESGGDLPEDPNPSDPESTPESEPEEAAKPDPEPEPVDPLVSYEANKTAADKVLASSQHYVALCDQINGRIIVCDLAAQDWSNDNAVVWEYLHYGKKKTINVDGLKFRDSAYYGKKVMIYCYPDGARIVTYDSKKQILWQVNGEDKVGVNIHSVELLPDGTVITASSNDGIINVFAPGQTTSCQTVSLASAHGVLWDPAYNVVWAVGTNMLVRYRVEYSSGKPQLVKEKTYYSPKAGMHDLAADYGDPHRLLFTCSAGIMVFDKRTGTMNYSYSGGAAGKDVTYAPGCGLFSDGVFVYTSIVSGQTVYKEWCTNKLHYYVPLNKDQGCLIVRTMPDDAYYKVRIVDFDYQ